MSDPTEDAKRFHATLSRADSIVVVEGHAYDAKRRKNNKILARSRDEALVTRAAAAVTPAFAAPRMGWMTPGKPTIAFLRDRELLAAITLLVHRPSWVRCEELLGGDAPIVDRNALFDVLIELAAPTVKERLDAGQAPDSIAKDVRSASDLTGGRVAHAMVRGGLSVSQAHVAARSTMTDEELASHLKLKDGFWDAMESADEDGPAS